MDAHAVIVGKPGAATGPVHHETGPGQAKSDSQRLRPRELPNEPDQQWKQEGNPHLVHERPHDRIVSAVDEGADEGEILERFLGRWPSLRMIRPGTIGR